MTKGSAIVTTKEVVLSSLLTGQQVATALDRLEKEYPQAKYPSEYVVIELLTNKDNRLAFDTTLRYTTNKGQTDWDQVLVSMGVNFRF